MKIKATLHPHGVEFTLTAECEYEHGMLKFLASTAYECRGAFVEESSGRYGWQTSDPTRATLHLTRPKPQGSPSAASNEEGSK